jgi:hypothetical protein
MDYRQRQYSLSTPLYHLGPPALLCLQAVRTMALLCLQAVGTAALLCLGSRYYGLTLPSGSRHRGLTLPSGSRHYGPGPHHTTLWPYAVVHNPHTHSLTHTCLLTHLLRTVLSIPIPPVKHTHVGSDHRHYWVCTSAVLGTLAAALRQSSTSITVLCRTFRPASQCCVGTHTHSTSTTVLCRHFDRRHSAMSAGALAPSRQSSVVRLPRLLDCTALPRFTSRLPGSPRQHVGCALPRVA